MSVQPLHEDLRRFASYWGAEESEPFQRYLGFVSVTPDCCLRTHLAGHCTGSAFIVCPRFERTLLLYHPFLQRWLQPGGHADGDPDLLQVAVREAHEETGIPLDAFHPVALGGLRRVPFDLDIHSIPARGEEPPHLHYDLRFLLTADPALPITPESPAMLVEWVALEAVRERTDEESVLRLVRKVERLRDRL